MREARKGVLALAAVRVCVLDGLCGSWGSPAMRKAALKDAKPSLSSSLAQIPLPLAPAPLATNSK